NACPCIAEIGEFGRVGVTSKEAAAADVTVDVPSGLWTAVRLSNEAPGQDRTKSCDASESDETCCATVALDNYTIDPSIGDDTTREPWRNQGSANYPGAPAVADAGFAVQATSKECSPVTSTEDPGNFVGRD